MHDNSALWGPNQCLGCFETSDFESALAVVQHLDTKLVGLPAASSQGPHSSSASVIFVSKPHQDAVDSEAYDSASHQNRGNQEPGDLLHCLNYFAISNH